ncbi:hypothetical protein ACXR2U_08645 [Jatrophihabitans sp. YIM 134969]
MLVETAPAHPPRRRRRGRRLAWVAVAVLVTAIGLLAPVVYDHVNTPPPVPVTIDLGSQPEGTMPESYAGFSFEKTDLKSGLFAPGSELADVFTSLGPQVLRIGGNSADRSSTPGRLPGTSGGAYVPDASVLSDLHEFLEQTKSTAIYTIALQNNTASNAASEADTVARALGSTLAAFAIGNEPDLYKTDLPAQPWTPQSYVGAAAPLDAAVELAVPGAEIVGPDAAGTSWFPQMPAAISRFHAITQHYYSLGCKSSGDKEQQRDRLLSNAATGLDATKIAQLTKQAAALGKPLWLDEANSTSCAADTDQLANTGAAALWAVAFMLSTAKVGVVHVDFHSSLNSCKSFSPVCVDSKDNSLRGQPLLNAMRLVGLVGSGTFLPTTTTPASSQTPSWAVRHSDGSVTMLVLNLTAKALSVTVPGVSFVGAASLDASSLAGRVTSVNGTSQPGPGVAAHVEPLTGRPTTVTVGAYSASVLTLPS